MHLDSTSQIVRNWLSVLPKQSFHPLLVMINPVKRICRLYTDPSYVKQKILFLYRNRRRGHLRPDERRSILRFFYGLYTDSIERDTNMAVNSRMRTARFLVLARIKYRALCLSGVIFNKIRIVHRRISKNL